ncbi:Hypothetical predicted protein [Paramuricea clavata]|uniref:Uncharacterized protein n=1 Tax=Paramuricea clavata TaxID=317549 RepID=A0A6S7IBH4_PARCT|nr:Hypothetical predicted protein [Paramuricea clavata]
MTTERKTPQKTQKKRDTLAEKGRNSQPSHHSSNDYPDSPDLFIDSTHSHPSDEIPTLEHPDVRAKPPEELAVPKEIQRSSIAKVVEIQPLLGRFLDHLLLVEGGRRGPKPSREAQWRVGRLLYEVDETLANVNLLWNDDAMVHIRCAFIEGNHLLTKPRKVGTLQAYLSALLMFYNFLLTRASSLANKFVFQQNDFSLVKEFQGRVSNWMKSFTEESASRKTEVHQEDFQSLLTSSQMWNLFNSPLHDKFEKRFEKLDDPENELCDYLITMLLLQSAQHPGAVCNLTINKFQAGEWDESTSVKQFVTLTKRHKTAGTGPASLSWDTRIYKCAQIYLEISNRITKVAKLLDPSISGNVTGKQIRKSAVSSHRQLDDSGESSGLSKEELAWQMSHSTSTADGHYAMRDTIKGHARASNFLCYVVATTPGKAKSPKKMKPEGLWKAVVRRKVSPEKPL